VEKEIEEIEHYYLRAISKYISADTNSLVRSLQNYNRDTDQDNIHRGTERVIYVILNRGDILGVPNSNPNGSDISFHKYDNKYDKYLNIHIDVKTINIRNKDYAKFTIGHNQNSFSDIMYKEPEVDYKAGLEPILNEQNHMLGDKQVEYLTLTYLINVYYVIEQKKIIIEGMFCFCIPNGKLISEYEKAIGPGKNNGIMKEQTITYTSLQNQSETLKIKKKLSWKEFKKISKDDYSKFKTNNPHIKWDIPSIRYLYSKDNLIFRFYDVNKKRLIKLWSINPNDSKENNFKNHLEILIKLSDEI
jgi:hypothetical protein